jgi:hypothetical protein
MKPATSIDQARAGRAPTRVRRNHSGAGRNHYWRATQSFGNELPGIMVAVGQEGVDHVGTDRFDLHCHARLLEMRSNHRHASHA